MKKYLEIIHIKPENVQDYIRLHQKPWPEMLQAEIDAGIEKEVIFFYNNMSIIYSECEDYERCDKILRSTDVCKEWDKVVLPWTTVSMKPQKIFDLKQQANGIFLPD